MSPHGSKYGVVVDVRRWTIPDVECMNVPSTTSLRFNDTNILRSTISVPVIPSKKLLPKLLVVFHQPDCISHIFGIGQSYPSNICRSSYVRIYQRPDTCKSVPDRTCTFRTVVDMRILEDFTSTSVNVVVCVEFDTRASTGRLLPGNYFNDISHSGDFCRSIIIHIWSNIKFAYISHIFTSLS